jgi:hypothetical protein
LYCEAITDWYLAQNPLPKPSGITTCYKSSSLLIHHNVRAEGDNPAVQRGQNGMIERFFRTIKEECIWHHNFKSIKEANEIISKWIDFYNNRRKHSALCYKAPAEVFQLVA